MGSSQTGPDSRGFLEHSECVRRPRKIRRVNQQRHQVPREGAGAGTANRHQGSAFRNVPKPSGAGARTPPKGHLLRKPSWIAPPLPGHLCCTSVSSPTAHTGLQSPFIPSVPTCGEPRAHAQCALGESTGSPRKEKSHLADTPELPGTVSPFAQRRPLDLVEAASAFSKPRHLVCEAMLSQLGYDEPSRAACHQGLRGTPAAKPSAYRLPRSFAKWC